VQITSDTRIRASWFVMTQTLRNCILGTQGREAVLGDADKTLQPMAHAREPDLASLRANTVFDLKTSSESV